MKQTQLPLPTFNCPPAAYWLKASQRNDLVILTDPSGDTCLALPNGELLWAYFTENARFQTWMSQEITNMFEKDQST